jgi:ACS family hexuronate transporter-like MFS transporter
MLFASTVINYIDRQTLSVLAPFLKTEYGWTNEDYALIVIAFRTAYAIGQTLLGRFMDRVGTRLGLTITVTWYSIIAMLTSLASGLRSFAFFRFLLGLGESPNWPAATKAVSEWFPKRERGWAVALFDSGSSIGAAIAPSLVIWLYHSFGGWQPAFLITGTLGFIWLIFWRMIYYRPEEHPRISEEERTMILSDREAPEPAVEGVSQATELPRPSWWSLLAYRQTWGVIAARALTDPVWFFIADWFMIYLVSKGFSPEDTLVAFWIPFVACDLGNFAGGGFSSYLIKRGWPVGRARKAVVAFGAIGMTLLVPTVYMSSLFAIAGLFAISTFAYATFCTMVLVFPSDLYQSHSVATVSGLSGSAVPLIGAVLVFVLIRNTKQSGEGVLLRI